MLRLSSRFKQIIPLSTTINQTDKNNQKPFIVKNYSKPIGSESQIFFQAFKKLIENKNENLANGWTNSNEINQKFSKILAKYVKINNLKIPEIVTDGLLVGKLQKFTSIHAGKFPFNRLLDEEFNEQEIHKQFKSLDYNLDEKFNQFTTQVGQFEVVNDENSILKKYRDPDLNFGEDRFKFDIFCKYSKYYEACGRNDFLGLEEGKQEPHTHIRRTKSTDETKKNRTSTKSDTRQVADFDIVIDGNNLAHYLKKPINYIHRHGGQTYALKNYGKPLPENSVQASDSHVSKEVHRIAKKLFKTLFVAQDVHSITHFRDKISRLKPIKMAILGNNSDNLEFLEMFFKSISESESGPLNNVFEIHCCLLDQNMNEDKECIALALKSKAILFSNDQFQDTISEISTRNLDLFKYYLLHGHYGISRSIFGNVSSINFKGALSRISPVERLHNKGEINFYEYRTFMQNWPDFFSVSHFLKYTLPNPNIQIIPENENVSSSIIFPIASRNIDFSLEEATSSDSTSDANLFQRHRLYGHNIFVRLFQNPDDSRDKRRDFRAVDHVEYWLRSNQDLKLSTTNNERIRRKDERRMNVPFDMSLLLNTNKVKVLNSKIVNPLNHFVPPRFLNVQKYNARNNELSLEEKAKLLGDGYIDVSYKGNYPEYNLQRIFDGDIPYKNISFGQFTEKELGLQPEYTTNGQDDDPENVLYTTTLGQWEDDTVDEDESLDYSLFEDDNEIEHQQHRKSGHFEKTYRNRPYRNRKYESEYKKEDEEEEENIEAMFSEVDYYDSPEEIELDSDPKREIKYENKEIEEYTIEPFNQTGERKNTKRRQRTGNPDKPNSWRYDSKTPWEL